MPLARPPADTPVLLQGNRNYTWQHYPTGHKVLIPYTLKQVMLRHPHLVRVHHSIAVDLTKVECFVRQPKGKSSYLRLKSGQLVPVSRRKLTDVHLALTAQRPDLTTANPA